MTGFVVSALAVVKLLSKVEHSFNDIWGVKEHRTLMRKLSDYISAGIVVPVLILLSSTSTFLFASDRFKIFLADLGDHLQIFIKR